MGIDLAYTHPLASIPLLFSIGNVYTYQKFRHGNGVTYPIGGIIPDRYTLLSTNVQPLINNDSEEDPSSEDELLNRNNQQHQVFNV